MHLSHYEEYVTMISGIAKLIECSRRASILVPIRIELLIKYALY